MFLNMCLEPLGTMRAFCFSLACCALNNCRVVHTVFTPCQISGMLSFTKTGGRKQRNMICLLALQKLSGLYWKFVGPEVRHDSRADSFFLGKQNRCDSHHVPFLPWFVHHLSIILPSSSSIYRLFTHHPAVIDSSLYVYIYIYMYIL